MVMTRGRATPKFATVLVMIGLLVGWTATADAHVLSGARAHSEAATFNHAYALVSGARSDGVRECTRNDSHEFVCVTWVVWPDGTACDDAVRVYYPSESSFTPRVAPTPEPPVCQ
jgi:hypothetical protein